MSSFLDWEFIPENPQYEQALRTLEEEQLDAIADILRRLGTPEQGSVTPYLIAIYLGGNDPTILRTVADEFIGTTK